MRNLFRIYNKVCENLNVKTFLLFTGEPMYAHQDLGRLLLLRVGPACIEAQPRLQLRQYGPAND